MSLLTSCLKLGTLEAENVVFAHGLHKCRRRHDYLLLNGGSIHTTPALPLFLEESYVGSYFIIPRGRTLSKKAGAPQWLLLPHTTPQSGLTGPLQQDHGVKRADEGTPATVAVWKRKIESHLIFTTTSIQPLYERNKVTLKNISSLSEHRGAAPWSRNIALPAGLGAPAPEHSHVLFVQALIGQRGEVCQHEKWFPPWQETCYTSSRLFEKNMFFPLCI